MRNQTIRRRNGNDKGTRPKQQIQQIQLKKIMIKPSEPSVVEERGTPMGWERNNKQGGINDNTIHQ